MVMLPKRARLLGMIVIGSVIASFFIGLAFWSWYTPEQHVTQLEIEVKTESLLGFNTGKDRLDFGSIGPEGYSERKSTVVSAARRRVVVKLEGEIAPMITVSTNNFLLEPGVPQDILFRATAPADMRPGNFTGTAIISYHRVLFWE